MAFYTTSYAFLKHPVLMDVGWDRGKVEGVGGVERVRTVIGM